MSTLDDVWGKDAERVRQQLGDATSWRDRFAVVETALTRRADSSQPVDPTQLGLGPKSAARLVRFDHAAHRLAAGEGIARVAADSGYTDQSHLHRDVLAFTGATPATVVGEWLKVDSAAWRRPRLAEPIQTHARQTVPR